MIDCTDKNPCESKSPEGKCKATVLGYCPHQKLTPEETEKLNKGEDISQWSE
jgi:hypothetical protein